MLAPLIHLLPITTIQRERLLPVDGKVLVRAGQKVNATDFIAEGNLYSNYLLLDIARSLKISVEKVDEILECQTGDQLGKGDIIAGPIGFTRRLVRAPQGGRVVLAGNGRVLLESIGKTYKIQAGLPGEVIDLIPNRGAVIEMEGALVQGIWGNGKVEYGLMYILATEPNHIITVDQLDVSIRGAIIMAGHCQDIEVLRLAEQLPLRGLILSSMAPSLVATAQEISIPIIVTDGIGRVPMNPVAHKLLSTNDKNEVALLAEPWDHLTGTRPEIVIPFPGLENTSPAKDIIFFAPEQSVRVVRQPHMAKIGTIKNILSKNRFPSGLVAQAAEIQLDNGEKVILPLANLEVLA